MMERSIYHRRLSLSGYGIRTGWLKNSLAHRKQIKEAGIETFISEFFLLTMLTSLDANLGYLSLPLC